MKNRIAELLGEKNRVIAVFDGRSASGKSTAAALLAEQLDGEIVHMDDFFLPRELRTPERLGEAGGNVHYERFAREVLCGLESGRPFDYRVFDCSAMDFGGRVRAGEKRLVIVEGAYSLHPSFGRYYDCAVFFDVDPEVQKRRILARNGAVMLDSFTRRWIPMEERYIAAFGITERCDMVIKEDTR